MDEKQLREKIKDFVKVLQLERELQFKVLDIEMFDFDDQKLTKKIELQDNLIADIEKLRMQGMMPMIEELAGFVAMKKAEAEGKPYTPPEKVVEVPKMEAPKVPSILRQSSAPKAGSPLRKTVSPKK